MGSTLASWVRQTDSQTGMHVWLASAPALCGGGHHCSSSRPRQGHQAVCTGPLVSSAFSALLAARCVIKNQNKTLNKNANVFFWWCVVLLHMPGTLGTVPEVVQPCTNRG